MKICLLSRRFTLESGGIGRVGISLRDGLRRLGHEVITVETSEEDLAHYFMYSFWSIKNKIPKGMDIYHAITPMESIYLPKHKSVATILDIIPITHPDKHGARMGGSKIKYTIGRTCFDIGVKKAIECAKVVCISDHVKDEVIEHYNVSSDKISTIRLGIRDDLKPLHIKDRIFRIGYLGQLDRRKRVDLLIKAFKESDIKGELLIAGKGFNEAEFKELAKGDERIRFIGYIENGEIKIFYNNLDYLCFPTSIEGFGLPPVEAMACKVPCIVLSDAIIPEEVKERCIVVNSLSKAFRAIQNGNYVGAVHLNSNYEFARLHNWNNTVNEYVKLYEEILR